jgi:hypothetical protein
MGGRTQCRVAPDTRRSADLIQTIRCRLGGAWWRRLGAGAARRGRPPNRPDRLRQASTASGQERLSLVGALQGDQRFPRLPLSVRGEVMRSWTSPGPAHRGDAVAAGKGCNQPVAGKVMGLPGGAAAPSSGVTVVRPPARPEPCGRPAWPPTPPVQPPPPAPQPALQGRQRVNPAARLGRAAAPGRAPEQAALSRCRRDPGPASRP